MMRNEMQADLSKLSFREKDVLRLLAKGLSNELIANQLVLSPRTIGGHQLVMIEKFGLKDEAELMRLAKAVFL